MIAISHAFLVKGGLYKTAFHVSNMTIWTQQLMNVSTVQVVPMAAKLPKHVWIVISPV